MNLARVQQFLSRLSIKHRDLNVSVPFHFNVNQQKAHRIVSEHYERDKWIRTITLKARRVGMSSYWDSILFCHCLARAQAHGEIVAHLKEISDKGLFRVPRDLALELNARIGSEICDVRAKEIRFQHTSGESRLDIATAGSVGGGRGLTLTALHLSEAALYPGQDSFLSILPAVSKAPDTIIALESTAQGRVGIGQAFYEHWIAAGRRGRQWNGYVQIFLSWLDDPACFIDHPAEDAPATDLERELMASPFNASRKQIAWMRRVLESECQGSEAKFLQEYPHTPEVAFVATGDPAFHPSEIKYAYATRRDELSPPDAKPELTLRYYRRGSLSSEGSNRIRFVDSAQGRWHVYEQPKRGHYYYLGVDCARGLEHETGRATGDFTAVIILNGTTGNVAAKFSEWVDPDMIAHETNKAARYYNLGMVIIELTGNLGLWAQKTLREDYRYPNLYVWKGKDDRTDGKGSRNSAGWETTARTRDLLFATYRGTLRDGMRNLPGGFAPVDAELIEQMDRATLSTGLRWEVEKGHDDVLMAAMLACIARAQYPPPTFATQAHNVLETPEQRKESALESLRAQPDLHKALRRDLAFVFRKERRITRALGMANADKVTF